MWIFWLICAGWYALTASWNLHDGNYFAAVMYLIGTFIWSWVASMSFHDRKK